MKLIVSIFFTLLLSSAFAQKKVMQNEDKALWNRIRSVNISNSGDYVLYSLEKGEKDQTIQLLKINGEQIMTHERSKGGQLSYNSEYAIFKVNAWKDSITEMKRRKVKKKDLPKDTLVIYDIEKKSFHKIPNVKSYSLPEKWSGVVAYMLEAKQPKKKDKTKKDSTNTKEKDTLKTKKKKLKKVSKDNGFHLVIRNLANGKEDTLKYVHSYKMAKKGKHLLYATSGEVDSLGGGVYHYDVEKSVKTLLLKSHHKTTYPQLGISESGKRIGFVVDADSTKSLIKKPKLYSWNSGDNEAKLIVDSKNNASNLLVSKDRSLEFSKNENRLFFGLRPKPIVQDTTLLDEEIVNVEVWTYNEPRLYTVQEIDVKDDKKKSFLSLWDFEQNKVIEIANADYDMVRYADEGNGDYAVIGNQKPYLLQSQWTVQFPADLQRVDLKTGERKDPQQPLRSLYQHPFLE